MEKQWSALAIFSRKKYTFTTQKGLDRLDTQPMVTIVTTNASATGSTQRTNPQSLVPPSKNEIPLQEVVDQRQLESTGPDNSLAFGDVERWNRPHVNQYRLAAVFFTFVNFGMNDGSYGALVPYVCSVTLSATFPSVAHLRFCRSKKTTIFLTLSLPWSSFRLLRAIR